MYHWTTLTTLLSLAVYFFTSIRVAQARMKTGIKAPSTTGSPEFERTFRVQMNTLEWLPIFLPSMWLSALYIGDFVAALGGLLWIIGRILYMQGYIKAAEKRGPGFGIQAVAAFFLWGASLFGVIRALLQ